MKRQSRVSQGLSILQRQVSIFLFALAALVQVSLPVADQAFHHANGQNELAAWHEGTSAGDTKHDGSTLPDSHEHDCPICQALLHGAGAALVPEQVVFTLATQIVSATLVGQSAVPVGAMHETSSRPRAPPILN